MNSNNSKGSLYYLEFLPIIENADEIWSLLTLISTFSNDKFIQTLICHKLYSFKPVEVDFFLPQLCQLVIDKQSDVSPIRNFLIDQCRRSSRSGLLSSFFFNAAAIDNVPSTTSICQHMILDIELAALSGNKNSEYASYMDLYKRHMLNSTAETDFQLQQQSQAFKDGYINIGRLTDNERRSVVLLSSDHILILERLVYNILHSPIDSAASFLTLSSINSIHMKNSGNVSPNRSRNQSPSVSTSFHLSNSSDNPRPDSVLQSTSKLQYKASQLHLSANKNSRSISPPSINVLPPTLTTSNSNSPQTSISIDESKPTNDSSTSSTSENQTKRPRSPSITPPSSTSISIAIETIVTPPSSPKISPRSIKASSPRSGSVSDSIVNTISNESLRTDFGDIPVRRTSASKANLNNDNSDNTNGTNTNNNNSNTPNNSNKMEVPARIGFTRSTSVKEVRQKSGTPENNERTGETIHFPTTPLRDQQRQLLANRDSDKRRTLSLGRPVSVNLPSTTSSLIATEPTMRKSTSLEDVTNTGENSDSSDTTPKLGIVIPDSIEVEESYTNYSTSPRSAPLAQRPHHVHNRVGQLNRPKLGLLSGTNASTNRLSIDALNMKRLKSHGRHTSCPVDLSYKVKCSMCGMAVDIDKVVSHTKLCDGTGRDENDNISSGNLRNSTSSLDLAVAKSRANSITNIHKKVIKGTELNKLILLTQVLTDITAIRAQNILDGAKIQLPDIEEFESKKEESSSSDDANNVNDHYVSESNVNVINVGNLVDVIYSSTKNIDLLDTKVIHAQQKFATDASVLHNVGHNSRIIEQQTLERKYKRDYFESQIRFVKGLTDISVVIRDMNFKTKELKNEALRLTLSLLNEDIYQWTNSVYIPLLTPHGTPYRILRILPNEALCLNSKFRVPYLINIEVVNGEIEAQSNAVDDESSQETSCDKDITLVSDTTGSRWKQTNVCIVNDYNSKENEKKATNTVLDDIFGQDWGYRKEKMRQGSIFGKVKGWDLISIIVKGGDDLRQEQLAMQLIQLFADIFKKEKLACLQLRPYMVLATSGNAGLIETIHDAISIHGLKASQGFETLYLYFLKAYGGVNSQEFKDAQINFIESIAAYSLVLYLLQIKDRHNGNILITRGGHVIHIDYGFMLTSSPANIDFEKSPFKLPLEMVEVMGGANSEKFEYFKILVGKGYLALRRNYLHVISAVELMLKAGGGMTCFQGASDTISSLKDRFRLDLTEEECLKFCDKLVLESMGNWRSELYDNFQYYSNGIL